MTKNMVKNHTKLPNIHHYMYINYVKNLILVKKYFFQKKIE